MPRNPWNAGAVHNGDGSVGRYVMDPKRSTDRAECVVAEVYHATDATLIAAAPQMLSALEDLANWMREHTGPADGCHDILINAVNVIEAAGGTLS